jgi:hypothetical protein
MIKFDSKATQRGKALHRRCRVTDRADLVLIVGKLLYVTARTGHMPGHFWRNEPSLTFMAEKARHARMLCTAVLKSGKIPTFKRGAKPIDEHDLAGLGHRFLTCGNRMRWVRPKRCRGGPETKNNHPA